MARRDTTFAFNAGREFAKSLNDKTQADLPADRHDSYQKAPTPAEYLALVNYYGTVTPQILEAYWAGYRLELGKR